MWSKQQQQQQQDTRQSQTNKNMTSFKNKITNRKRKNSKTRTNTTAENVDSPEPVLASSKAKHVEDKDKEKEKEKPKQTKSGGKHHRGRNRNKKDSNPAPNSTAVNKSDSGTTNSPATGKQQLKSNSDVVVIKNDLETADVVLRNPTNIKRTNSNNSIKRYSDSIVIDNDNGQIKLREESDVVPPILTRAVSGFFIIDQAKKARRLSDLFRPHSAMKLSISTENLNNEKNSIKSEKMGSAQKKEEKKNAKLVHKNSVSAAKRNVKNETTAKVPAAAKESSSSSNSYLKRVRSKIYKSKSEQSVDEADSSSKSRKVKPKKSNEISSSRIPEDEVAVLTPNGLRTSITNFDFRLTRQTSNLERARPKTMDATDSGAAVPSDKPVLPKSKSSSSINLSLLRTRRNQILDKVASRLGAKDVHNEFDFIAFGGVNNVPAFGSVNNVSGLYGSQTNLQKQPSWLHIHKEEQGEIKQSHPVSRSGSDRRPDAVREEALKQQDPSKTESSSSHDVPNDRMEAVNMVSSTILPAAGNHRKHNSNINRSESVKEQSEKRKQRRNISDPSHNTTSGDVDLERHTALSNTTDSGSSSNSSISCNGRLSESPSNSVDVVTQDPTRRGTLDSDSDIDAESEQWQNLVSIEELKNLSPHEKKRQDVINELFHTESSHVRNLKVLYKIFYKKIQESHTLKPEELNLIFPNIKEILDLHTDFNKEMRRRRKEDPIVKEVGSLLGNMFGDRYGESLKKAAATFCERQQMALEFIKKRRERDSKFDAVLVECEKKRQCRRLPFQGILPTQMQRLSKYPLLLERLIHSVESNKDKDKDNDQQQEELASLKKAHQMSKEILNQVNEAAKVAHNKHRLEEIQKHLDTSGFERSEQPIAQEFKTLDLTKFRLILEGGMQLRRPNKPVVPVHTLLLEEAVVILHRDSDRFLLKFFQSGSPAQPQPLSPIIKMNMLLARTNAVCKNALFLVNMAANNSQMYDLVVDDEIKREVWFKHFTDATESYNKRQGKSSDRQDPASDSETESVQDLPPAEDVAERAETVGGGEEESAASEEAAHDGPDATASRDPTDAAPPLGGEAAKEKDEDARDSCTSPEMVAGGGIQTTKVSAEEWPLIQPSQVSVAVPPVHVAESMLTPLEQIRRKDAVVKQALEDKEGLVADMLSIPREHFEHIADMAASLDPDSSGGGSGGGRDPSEKVLASIFQVNQLQKAVNESLNITELDAMAAKGGRSPTCASQRDGGGGGGGGDEEYVTAGAAVPTIPTSLVREIASSLNSQLTTLLSEVKQIEEERDRLRKELHRVRERLHEEHNLHSPLPADDDNATDCVSDQSTFNESLQLISKSDCDEEEQ